MKKYTKEELYKIDAVDVYKMVLKGNVIKTFPRGFWQQPEAKQNAAKCTRYLIEKLLNYNDEDIKNKLSVIVFKSNKLGGMINMCFDNSPYNAINNAYPNRFKEWEFGTVPRGYWNDKENAIKCVKWLIEEKLKLDDEEIKEKLSNNLFRDNNLSSMLLYCFNGSIYEAINTVYPNKFKEWGFKYTPMGFWDNKENGIKAARWLIEEKLKLDDEELKEQLSANLFIKNGLNGMLQYCFNSSPYEVIDMLYPNKFKEWEFKYVPRK